MAEQEQKQEAPENKTGTKKGSEYVEDFGGPDGLARFKQIYGHMKEYERVIVNLRDHNTKLMDRLEKIEYAAQDAANKAEAGVLKHSLRAAKESGNVEAEVDIQAKLAATQARKPVITPRPPEIEVPDITVNTIRAWANEVTEDGEFVRPWAQQAHPKYEQVLGIAQESMNTYNNDVDKVLAVIDEKMAVKKAPAKSNRQTTVLPSGGGRPRRNETELTAEQAYVADKMGISRDAYKKQLEILSNE